MIGIFDSGHGGLTVLRALTSVFPDQPFVYFGDHANAPYGMRSSDEILELTRAGVERLFVEGCDLVVLACNTAAAVALRRLQQEWLPTRAPGHRILGVLVPMVEAITRVPWMVQEPLPEQMPEPRTVGIFATPRTVASGAYPLEIGKRAPAVKVVQQGCPELAGAIEAGAEEHVLSDLVQGYVTALLGQLGGRAPDAVVLGCTHYPLVARHFAASLPPGVEILSQPDLVAASLAHYLERHPEFRSTQPVAARPFLTSGQAAPISRLASRFFGQPVVFDTVDTLLAQAS